MKRNQSILILTATHWLAESSYYTPPVAVQPFTTTAYYDEGLWGLQLKPMLVVAMK